MKPLLEIKEISKSYKLLHEQQSYLSLRDILSKPSQFFKKNSTEVFNALDSVSFEVMQGESIGIIGKNGAGKSTLLKILSKITPPTSGTITSRGRIASLLEVGTGFHPELSGRENIFLNGSILGMKRKEILAKFDEIVDFSSVEKFLDTPLKHYSSGMQLRLAFAVAAFLEPEILIIDEVLAVGDAEFQRKCINKMDSITHHEGRTILIVSHNMSVLKKLCSRAIMLQKGKVLMNADANTVIDTYLKQSIEDNPRIKKGNSKITVNDIEIFDQSHNRITSFHTFDSVNFVLNCTASQDFDKVSIALCFNNMDEVRISSLWSKLTNQLFDIKAGPFKVHFNIPCIQLIPGEYNLVTYIDSNGYELEQVENFKLITVSFKPGNGYITEPGKSQALYLENFNMKIID
ncbi:MAG: hypothetical protein RIQ89_1302 [Bacteroidota bacterium]|jgi:lipopolysaccharide transport system ATP-binding protein